MDNTTYLIGAAVAFAVFLAVMTAIAQWANAPRPDDLEDRALGAVCISVLSLLFALAWPLSVPALVAASIVFVVLKGPKP